LVQSGKPIIKIFQDQENIEWGEAWKEHIKKVLNESLMLIAVVTPSYFESASCRFELEYFLKQNTHLEQRLILPILYIDTPKLSDTEDFVAIEISKREWIDWKDLRFASLTSAKVNKRIELLAKQIHNIMAKQENINKHRASVSSQMPLPPDNFPNRWDDEWQPFFELVNATENTKLTDNKILPPPALYVPLAKEEGITNLPNRTVKPLHLCVGI